MLKQLKQSDFKMAIIKDLFMQYQTNKSKKKVRMAIFECTSCKVHLKNNATIVKSKKLTICKKCADKNKMPKLKQKDYDLRLIKDLGTQYPNDKSKQKYRFAIFECPICCDNFRTQAQDVKNKATTKCRTCASIKHNLSDTKLYAKWSAMKDRCYNPNNKHYVNYGGRGIKVCDEWINDFMSYCLYVSSLNNFDKQSYSIDRIDNDSDYKPNNLRWASPSTQLANRRKTKKNTSGYIGVKEYSHCKGLWYATINVNNKSIFIGASKIKLECAKKRDKYIIDNDLPHTLNNVL